MLPLSTLIPFFGIALVLGLTPGPDNLFVLLQSAMRGPRSGMLIVSGLCSGLLVHTLVVAVGLGALLVASTIAFTALKLAGAAYLVYLAWQAWHVPVSAIADNGEIVGTAHLYRRGLLMNLSNPKVVIFFLAFLPQFVIASRGHIGLQIVILGSVFIVASLLVFSLIALCSGMGGKLLLRSPRVQRGLNRVASMVFVGLALKLATARL